MNGYTQADTENFNVPYDPYSIMHYSSKAWAINKNKPTIKSKVNSLMLAFNLEYVNWMLNVSYLIIYQCRKATSKKNILEELELFPGMTNSYLDECMDAVSWNIFS